MTAIRKVEHGDLLDVVQRLRKLLDAADSASFVLFADFTDIGGDELEDAAAKARITFELLAGKMQSLLIALEGTPQYEALEAEIKALRKRVARKPDGRKKVRTGP